MRKLLAMGLLAAVVLAMAGTPARAVDQDDIKRAIEKGVGALRRMQGENGIWPHTNIGATALAALTLLECGATADDKAVQRAAQAVRQASVNLTHTYSIALSILFLDRLGDAADVPLIESLMVRLLAGQDAEGGWTYDCPSISEAEARRLQAKVERRKETADRRMPRKSGDGKRSVKDLPEEIRQQLDLIDRAAAGIGVENRLMGGDNSNTQFAILALWVGRRHGLPVEQALDRIGKRFRSTQMPDGGWSYTVFTPPPGMPMFMPGMGSTASMTCAGLLGLAVADANLLEIGKERKPGSKPVLDISKDRQLTAGLLAISSVIDNPKNLRLGNEPPPQAQIQQPPWMARRVGGRTYYFLWSLERVAVALDLETIGKKDWYGWGAEILLANQGPDGSWAGDYADSGADTCFALLFLRRANLARDLTGYLKGKLKDPGERSLRAGGVGGGSLRVSKGGLKSGIETKDARPIRKPLQDPKPAGSDSARLAGALVKASGPRQTELLDQLRDGKGVKYTEALAAAIPQLDDEPRRKARDALAERLTRMKVETLASYLEDEDAEIRRAAALAVAMKESKDLIPSLIGLLRDPERTVVRAAHAALKALTSQDFGPAANASREERERAALKWLAWWKKQGK